MKKIFLLIFLLFFTGCDTKIITDSYKGIDFRYDTTEGLATIKIDIKQAKLDFGGIDIAKTDKNTTWFWRYKAKDFLVNFYDENAIFAINGQFFNQEKNPTKLSFTTKSSDKIITDYMDNDLPKRSLIITKDDTVIIKEGYDVSDLKNPTYKNLIVGFSPKTDASLSSSVGRTYIAKTSDHNIIFFIAKSKSTEQMQQILENYGIKNEDFLMMDGGPSTQFAWRKKDKVQQFFGEWKVPHFFIISKKK